MLQLPNLTQDYPEGNDDQRPTCIDTKTPEATRRLGEEVDLVGPLTGVWPAGHGLPEPAGPTHFQGTSPPLRTRVSQAINNPIHEMFSKVGRRIRRRGAEEKEGHLSESRGSVLVV